MSLINILKKTVIMIEADDNDVIKVIIIIIIFMEFQLKLKTLNTIIRPGKNRGDI